MTRNFKLDPIPRVLKLLFKEIGGVIDEMCKSTSDDISPYKFNKIYGLIKRTSKLCEPLSGCLAREITYLDVFAKRIDEAKQEKIPNQEWYETPPLLPVPTDSKDPEIVELTESIRGRYFLFFIDGVYRFKRILLTGSPVYSKTFEVKAYYSDLSEDLQNIGVLLEYHILKQAVAVENPADALRPDNHPSYAEWVTSEFQPWVLKVKNNLMRELLKSKSTRLRDINSN